MALQGLFRLLEELPPWREVRQRLVFSNASIHLNVPKASRPFLVADLAGSPDDQESNLPLPDPTPETNSIKPSTSIVIITPRLEDAQRWIEELEVYLAANEASAINKSEFLENSQVLLFPASEVLPFQRLDVDDSVVRGRLRVLAHLSGASLESNFGTSQPPQAKTAKRDTIVVTTVAALLQKTTPHKTFLEAHHTLRVGQMVEVTPLLNRWVAMGYSFANVVELPGTASRRGGILDIYPCHAEFPTRIELWGDTIESMRVFDPETQRSIHEVESVHIIPAQEYGANQGFLSPWSSAASDETDNYLGEIREQSLAAASRIKHAELGCLLDYLSTENVLVFDEPERLKTVGEELYESEVALRQQKEEAGELPKEFPSPNWSWVEVETQLGLAPKRLYMESQNLSSDSLALGFTPTFSSWGQIERFANGVREQSEKGARVVILSPSTQRLGEVLQDHDVGSRYLSDLESSPPKSSVSLVPGSLAEGFTLALPSGSLILITDNEVFGRAKQRRFIHRRSTKRAIFLSELTPGIYVVHVDHGVGRFIGTRQVEVQNGTKEFLTLEYAEGDTLYVPTEHLDRLSPYFAPGEKSPKLTRLSTQEWSRIKERARVSAQKMAHELLDLYAARQVLPGFAFSPDTAWQHEMEEAFLYQETPDQLRALSEVKGDMEQPHPLDRLVCGDVGYGKTEIAIRAAFKAVQDSKQVALLCPTTILAEQHYHTFMERFAPFPVRIEVLSRFRTDTEIRAVVEGLRLGNVDVVIGTHRLVQKDVVFKDLGLLIIDDEQRFGVAHKERFKQLRQEIDVLTMTATPIPRTLYMAMAGIRDISTIETPPEDRQAVRTFVASYSEDLVVEAILRELDRGGQLFFLHNRVKDIQEWAVRIRELVPQARVAVGHGQMAEYELAAVITDFSDGKIDVLVCTTIIEAGLDMPNANTLIVHRPEVLGLAQMYQLRGRVGRGSRRAYAYFLTSKSRRITEAAEKRLEAMLTHQELGSGFRIAMTDLEIRGAGNLLGAEQSGNIHAVGFDLYIRLLEEAVSGLREQAGQIPDTKPPPRVTISLPLEAHLPSGYIGDLTQRLGIYQRLARAIDLNDIAALRVELKDRFGAIPIVVENLLFTVRVQIFARDAGIDSLAQDGTKITMRLREPTGGARAALQLALGAIPQVGDRLIRLHMGNDWPQELIIVLQRLVGFRKRLLALVANQVI
jgi:transcription-repair coupling factor (superfamily II helicase)